MQTALYLIAGTTVTFRLVPNSTNLLPAGSWTCRWGILSESGVYTAPSFLPPAGLDTVTYTDANQNSESVLVRISSTPSIEGSDTTPVFRYSGPHTAFMGKAVLLGPKESLPPILPVLTAAAPALESDTQGSFYRVPIEISDTVAQDLTLPTPPSPIGVCHLPDNPIIGIVCLCPSVP